MSHHDRVRMNSEGLRQAFPNVYRDFFSKCSTVVSAPGSFFWSAGLAVIYGGTGVLQKIPLRVYVGLERDGSPTLSFGDYRAFVPHQQQFERFYHEKSYAAKLQALLADLQATLPRPVNGKVHILSEVPRGAGLNLSGAMNMALSVLVGLESGLVGPQQLGQLTWAKTPDLLADPMFDRLFRLAWKFEATAHADIGSGSGPFAAFLESSSPIVFFSERRGGTFSRHPHTTAPSDVQGHYEAFDSIRYAGYRLKDLVGWQGDPSWPIDYGLLYLGQQKHSSVYLRPMLTVKAALDRLEDFVVDHLKTFPVGKGIDPSFFYMTQANQHHGYWEKSVNFLIILSVKAIADLKMLLESGTDDALNEFCETVELQEKLMEFVTKSLPTAGERGVLDRIKTTIAEKAHNGLRGIRFLPDRADGGGDLLFIAPQGALQDHLDELERILRNSLNPLVRVEYTSWADGEEVGGVRIEQDLDHACFSPFVTAGAFALLEWRGGGQPVRRVFTPEGLELAKSATDLLLDNLEHKVYVQGTTLTSEDIKSAKATIEILRTLLARVGEDVPAADLPPSAYVERNEMQSKIITPLVASFKRLTGKRLPLSLHGGLRKNFSMKLDRSELTIALLERQL